VNDAVEAYLDELLLELRGTPAEVRRALREVEEHLRDAVADELAAGRPEAEAARAAVARFGPAAAVAAELQPVGPVRSLRALLLELVWVLTPVGSLFLVAIGASGGVAAAMGAAFGKAFVAADAPGVAYTPARCAEYLALTPHAASCEAAAIADHYGEVVYYRLAAGVLGLLVLAAWWLVRRRSAGRLLGQRSLPASLPVVVGAALATVAALLLLGGSLVSMTSAVDGTGNELSGGIVSALLAAGFGLALWRDVRLRRFARS
jgi:hypothetical protein